MEKHILSITRTILGIADLQFVGNGEIGATNPNDDVTEIYAKMVVTSRADSATYEVVDNRREEPIFTLTVH